MNDATPNPAVQFTDDQLVSRYIALRDFLAAEAAAQAKHVEPYANGMQAIQGELHRRLLERNPNWRRGTKASGSTESGTFFLKTNTSVKVADRQAFHDYLFSLVLSGQADQARAFLTANVAKEAVETFMSEHNDALPVGVTVDYITECQVRKT